jgi:DNA-binding protein HU-beta
VNITDLAERVVNTHGLTKTQVKSLIESTFAAIAEAACSGEEVSLSGFGRFKVTERAARQGRNPVTGEVIQIPASKKLAFIPAKNIREALNAITSSGGNQKL